MYDPSQSRLAVAALFAALVEALDEKSEGLALSFTRHLDATRAKLSEESVKNREAMETLALTKTLLRDELDRSEPACVVYAKSWLPEEEQLPSSEKVQLPTLDEAVRFWARLPAYDQQHAAIETASGHRFEAAAVAALVKRYKDRPPV
jgi:hypothetical protein